MAKELVAQVGDGTEMSEDLQRYVKGLQSQDPLLQPRVNIRAVRDPAARPREVAFAHDVIVGEKQHVVSRGGPVWLADLIKYLHLSDDEVMAALERARQDQRAGR